MVHFYTFILHWNCGTLQVFLETVRNKLFRNKSPNLKCCKRLKWRQRFKCCREINLLCPFANLENNPIHQINILPSKFIHFISSNAYTH